jgi:hypothetical protein
LPLNARIRANSQRFQSFNQVESVTISRRDRMARKTSRGRGSRNADFGVMDMARERPLAAAAAAAGAAAAGLFLWSKRAQIGEQLNHLSDQIGEWKEGFVSSEGGEEFAANDDTAGLTRTGQTSRTTSRRGMSETGGGNASLGRRSGGGGTIGSATGRGRARSTTPQATR